jgi:hypothetical protein
MPGRTPRQIDKKMPIPMAAKKAVGAFPHGNIFFAGPPAKKIYEKGKPPMAALMLLLLLNTGMPPMKECEKLLALWPQETGRMPPMVVKAGMPPRRDYLKMWAPVVTQEVGKTP